MDYRSTLSSAINALALNRGGLEAVESECGASAKNLGPHGDDFQRPSSEAYRGVARTKRRREAALKFTD